MAKYGNVGKCPDRPSKSGVVRSIPASPTKFEVTTYTQFDTMGTGI